MATMPLGSRHKMKSLRDPSQMHFVKKSRNKQKEFRDASACLSSSSSDHESWWKGSRGGVKAAHHLKNHFRSIGIMISRLLMYGAISRGAFSVSHFLLHRRFAWALMLIISGFFFFLTRRYARERPTWMQSIFEAGITTCRTIALI